MGAHMHTLELFCTHAVTKLCKHHHLSVDHKECHSTDAFKVTPVPTRNFRECRSSVQKITRLPSALREHFSKFVAFDRLIFKGKVWHPQQMKCIFVSTQIVMHLCFCTQSSRQKQDWWWPARGTPCCCCEVKNEVILVET